MLTGFLLGVLTMIGVTVISAWIFRWRRRRNMRRAIYNFMIEMLDGVSSRD